VQGCIARGGQNARNPLRKEVWALLGRNASTSSATRSDHIDEDPDEVAAKLNATVESDRQRDRIRILVTALGVTREP
jgi:hypothetical protein